MDKELEMIPEDEEDEFDEGLASMELDD